MAIDILFHLPSSSTKGCHQWNHPFQSLLGVTQRISKWRRLLLADKLVACKKERK